MTELEQYKKAYATLVGRVDSAITNLEKAAELLTQEKDKFGEAGGNFVNAIITTLTAALQDTEDIFLDEDPEEE